MGFCQAVDEIRKSSSQQDKSKRCDSFLYRLSRRTFGNRQVDDARRKSGREPTK